MRPHDLAIIGGITIMILGVAIALINATAGIIVFLSGATISWLGLRAQGRYIQHMIQKLRSDLDDIDAHRRTVISEAATELRASAETIRRIGRQRAERARQARRDPLDYDDDA